MAIFRYRLASVLRLRENQRDRCRLEVAEARRAEEQAIARMLQLNEELAGLRRNVRDATRPGPIDIHRLRAAEQYEQQLHADLRQAEAMRQAAAAEVDSRRQALIEADREVHMLEKHRQQQLTRYRAEEQRRETKQLDKQTIMSRASRFGAKLRQLS